MRKNYQAGFSHVAVPLVVLVIAAIVGVGWYVANKQQDTKITNFAECAAAGNPIMESYPEQCSANGQTYIKQLDEQVVGRVTFIDASKFSEESKKKIVKQIVEPLVYYYEEILKIKLKDITVKVNGDSTPVDYGISYNYEDSDDIGFSTVFGRYDDKIGYHIPMLCDPGGCSEYPAKLKKEFPANYEAYLKCQADAKKDKQEIPVPSECLEI